MTFDAEMERLGREHTKRMEREKRRQEWQASLDALCVANGRHRWYLNAGGISFCKKCGQGVDTAVIIPGEGFRPKAKIVIGGG